MQLHTFAANLVELNLGGNSLDDTAGRAVAELLQHPACALQVRCATPRDAILFCFSCCFVVVEVRSATPYD
jgi:hypothetical protein